MNVLSVIRVVHIAVSALALVIVLVPLIAKKGGRVHRRVGTVFAIAMAISTVTAVPLIIARIAINLRFGLFLAQISLLSAGSLVFGLRALQTKTRVPGRRWLAERIAAAGWLVISIGFLAFAAWNRDAVFATFGLLGLLEARQWGRYFANPHREPFGWFLRHMSGMCVLGLVSLTAFTVTNARLLGVPIEWRWLAWIAPGVLGGIGLSFWQRKYRRRFVGGAAVSASAAAVG
jgi:uncharacterized membrane protein